MKSLTQRLAEKGFKAREKTFNGGITPQEAARQLQASLPKRVVSSVQANARLLGSFSSYLTAPGPQDFVPRLRDPRIKTKDLVFVLHGIGSEHGGKFRMLKEMGDKQGTRTLIPLTYDDEQPFEKYAGQVINEAKMTMDDSDFENAYLIGHSTGADVIRMANAQGKLNDIAGVVLAAPTTNGHVPGWIEKVAGFHDKTDYHNPKKEEGRRVLPLLQEPLRVPGVTVSYQNDFLVPLEASVDTHGHNLVVQGMGHLMGTGNHKRGNQLYLGVLDYLADSQAQD